MTPASAPRTNPTAIVALVVGIFGFCFMGLGGVLSIILGVMARREIARSEGRDAGAGLALAGIVLGALNLVSGVVAAGVMVAMIIARPTFSGPGAAPTVLAAPGPAPAPTASSAAPNGVDPSRPRATYERGVHATAIGKVKLVDVIPGKAGLRRALESEQKSALAAHERLLLFVVMPNCLPCNGVALGLRDARMQAALAGVRLVRVDANDFKVELAALDIPTDSVPGFALLSESLRPLDFVHGGEWDADVPENIAPVLGAFVRGKYTERRHRYRSAERPDETTL